MVLRQPYPQRERGRGSARSKKTKKPSCVRASLLAWRSPRKFDNTGSDGDFGAALVRAKLGQCVEAILSVAGSLKDIGVMSAAEVQEVEANWRIW